MPDDAPPRAVLTPEQVRFEIRFALGQAGASLFIGAHAKNSETRLRAIEQLTTLVAARFEPLEVTHVVRRQGPLFGR